MLKNSTVSKECMHSHSKTSNNDYRDNMARIFWNNHQHRLWKNNTHTPTKVGRLDSYGNRFAIDISNIAEGGRNVRAWGCHGIQFGSSDLRVHSRMIWAKEGRGLSSFHSKVRKSRGTAKIPTEHINESPCQRFPFPVFQYFLGIFASRNT